MTVTDDARTTNDETLDDVLLGPEPDWDEEPAALDLIDRGTAERYLRRVARLEADYDAERVMVQAQMDELGRWLEHRYQAYMERRAWLTDRLRRFHEALLSIDAKAKTVKLPSGELQMRARQPAWTFDAEAFLAWAQAHAPQLVRTVPETKALDVTAAKKYLTRTADDGVVERGITPDDVVPPGVSVRDVEPKFSVVLPGPEADDEPKAWPANGEPF